MKILFPMLLALIVVSCTKDKVPAATIDPNCTDSVSFATEVWPLIEQNCTSCHDVGNTTGYTLTNHTNISANASAIIGSMKASGFQLMPQGGPALEDSVIQRVQCWIAQGKKNN